jgi:hypothetical protein
MPDDYHPTMPRRNPEDIDLGAIKADLEFLIERGGAVPQGASPEAPLYDGRECRDRHRLDRASPTRLPIGSAPTTSSLRCRRLRGSVMLRWRWQRVTHRLRSDFGADRLQGSDALRQEIAVAVDDAV